VGGEGVLTFFFETHRGAQCFGVRVAGADQDRGVLGLLPRAEEVAHRIEAVDDDVVIEVERSAGVLHHLQHHDHRTALPDFCFDECGVAGDELRIEALLACGEHEVDGHDAAASLGEVGLPLVHGLRIAVMLQHGGEGAGAAGHDVPLLHGDVLDHLGGGRGTARHRRPVDARGEEKGGHEKGERLQRPRRPFIKGGRMKPRPP
jgi:hypothetical protein